ncbi:MAG: ribonuclease III, partial [Bacteroidia bacterium]|nr:ribonuclease III [Bacteroidia bacterium]
RLEYLGDAVFDTIIADYLYNHFPYRNEGFLTKMKSKIVNRENMDMLASKIGLDNLIIANIGRHEGKHLSGNTLEALIGAVYLDKGYLKAQKFVLKKIIKKFIDFQELEAQDFNYKSILVELCQKNKKIVVFETSETATSPSFFTSIALVENQNYGTGKGFSKKEAEQNAAEKALNRLKETSEDTCFNIKL